MVMSLADCCCGTAYCLVCMHRDGVICALQVDDSGKVQRLRKACPTCGPGIFMATHFNRVYWCGSLHFTDPLADQLNPLLPCCLHTSCRDTHAE